jgi:hypothetical protein
LRRRTVGLAAAFNRAIRDDNEWFDEPDDLDRVKRALAAIGEVEDLVEAVAYRVARAQGFAEGNKSTALFRRIGCSSATALTVSDSSRQMIESSRTFSSSGIGTRVEGSGHRAAPKPSMRRVLRESAVL